MRAPRGRVGLELRRVRHQVEVDKFGTGGWELVSLSRVWSWCSEKRGGGNGQLDWSSHFWEIMSSPFREIMDHCESFCGCGR